MSRSCASRSSNFFFANVGAWGEVVVEKLINADHYHRLFMNTLVLFADEYIKTYKLS